AAIQTMGDKIAAKATVSEFGVPVVPGIARPGLTDAELIAAADEIGYPVLVKPSAGGGGKGMRLVERAVDLPAALTSARRESAAAFGDDTLFLERFVLRPRHIEVQILADSYGNVVHLGERECSLQRRHQKVIEEAPSPLLDAATRDRIGAAACDTARSVDYTGAGTVEFIVSADRPDEFFFMEMNTRLQVEHPVTELVTGWDLVEWQVRIAAGEKLTTADVALRGHAIEARIYAEDPARGFLPTGGEVLELVEPKGAGVRIDSGLSVGTVVGSEYDPMLAKVIAHGADRQAALRALDRALADTAVLGVVTNVEFARFLLADPDVVAGRLDTGLLDRRAGDFGAAPPSDRQFIAAAAYRWLRLWPAPGANLWEVPSGWRIGTAAPVSIRLRAADRTDHVHLTGTPAAAVARIEDGESHALQAHLTGRQLVVTLDGVRTEYIVAATGHQIWLAGDGVTAVVEEVREAPVRPDDEHSGDAELISPMPGSVVAVGVDDGAEVDKGTVVVTIEAMKMEHALAAPIGGVVELLVAAGDQVKVGQPLARIIADSNAQAAEDGASD
ncbi:MAG: ATP-grasp domain-containing protein, partial [Mycobacterium sp.]|nr:ATP-grasp domain-containing protein [Mycobacterium sp.]